MMLTDQMVDRTPAVADQGPPRPAGLLDLVLELLRRPDFGGVQGLTRKFCAAGLGPEIQSWIGSGRKLPVTAAQVTRALGTGEVAQLAAKAGIGAEQAAQRLADLLPNTVVLLTPGGKPLESALHDIGDALAPRPGA